MAFFDALEFFTKVFTGFQGTTQTLHTIAVHLELTWQYPPSKSCSKQISPCFCQSFTMGPLWQ